jgi:hypothetical protein
MHCGGPVHRPCLSMGAPGSQGSEMHVWSAGDQVQKRQCMALDFPA